MYIKYMAPPISLNQSVDPWVSVMCSPGGAHPLRREGSALVDSLGRSYPIEHGIPRLLIESDLSGSDVQWNRFYDAFAPFYEINERFFGWVFTGLHMRTEQAQMVASLGIKPGCSLLEICTGPGVFQPLLAQAVGAEGRMVALDLSMGMLRKCARRTRQQRPVPLVIQANGDLLPFADASFDYVFHFGAIKLFTSPAKALLECARVLRPGARLFLGDEGFQPTIPKQSWRRQLMMRLSPGFQKPPPALPKQLKLIERRDVYDGLAFLWTLERIKT